MKRTMIAVIAAIPLMASLFACSSGSPSTVSSPPSSRLSSPAKSGRAAQQTVTWSAAEAPLPTDAVPSTTTDLAAELSGVSCPAVGRCVAIGWYINRGNYYDGLIETLSGRTWIPAPPGIPVPPGGAAHPDPRLNAVTCRAPGSCVAAGDYSSANYYRQYGLTEALSGGSWTPTSVAAPTAAGSDQEVSLNGVACLTVNSCIAVGDNFSNNPTGGLPAESQPLMAVLMNGGWTTVEAPLPTDAVMTNHIATLSGISCPALGSCVATGGYTDANGNGQGLMETLANGTWRPTNASLPADATGVRLGLEPRDLLIRRGPARCGFADHCHVG